MGRTARIDRTRRRGLLITDMFMPYQPDWWEYPKCWFGFHKDYKAVVRSIPENEIVGWRAMCFVCGRIKNKTRIKHEKNRHERPGTVDAPAAPAEQTRPTQTHTPTAAPASVPARRPCLCHPQPTPPESQAARSSTGQESQSNPQPDPHPRVQGGAT